MESCLVHLVSWLSGLMPDPHQSTRASVVHFCIDIVIEVYSLTSGTRRLQTKVSNNRDFYTLF